MRRRQLLCCALVGHGSVNRWLARPTLYSCTACCMLHANGFILHVVSATYCSPYCVLSVTCCMMCCASQQPTKTEQSIVTDRNARSCRVLSVLRRMLRALIHAAVCWRLGTKRAAACACAHHHHPRSPQCCTISPIVRSLASQHKRRTAVVRHTLASHHTGAAPVL